MPAKVLPVTILGHVHNGRIELDVTEALPEGALVRIEIVDLSQSPDAGRKRQGGYWKGRVQIADDFDVLPADLADALGACEP